MAFFLTGKFTLHCGITHFAAQKPPTRKTTTGGSAEARTATGRLLLPLRSPVPTSGHTIHHRMKWEAVWIQECRCLLSFSPFITIRSVNRQAGLLGKPIATCMCTSPERPLQRRAPCASLRRATVTDLLQQILSQAGFFFYSTSGRQHLNATKNTTFSGQLCFWSSLALALILIINLYAGIFP